MRFPYANLSAVGFAERAGNNGESVLEQLFDKLFKKALAHVENNTNEMHINEFLKCWSVGAAFLGVRCKTMCLGIDVLKSEEEVFYIGYTS